MGNIKKPRGIRQDRHCHRCRVKGIKCDLNRPRCQPCQQNGVACSYPQRVVWMGDKKATPEIALPISACSIAAANDAGSSQSRTQDNNLPINLYGFIDLLSHCYQEIQSSKEELPDEVVKLIARTLTFARCRLQGLANKQSIQTHLGALTNLSKVIESAHPIALFGIATFAIFEVCCGSFGRWNRHLQGARSLLDLHCRNKAELDVLAARIPGLGDVLAYLVWFDVMGALVQNSDLIFDGWQRRILSSNFFDSVGCPPDTFELFVHLVNRNIDLDVLDLSARAMNQILHLDNSETDRGLSASVYRCTGAIVAFGRAKENGKEDIPISSQYSDVLSKMVDRACDIIAKIPTSSRFYVHLATPAYLTGMHATNTRQCEILRAYWRNCQLCDFPRYPDAQEQCEQRWRIKMI
ncbi:hypothetical protein N7520_003857 [Penicillium odoratum]|uniref:uncharacterized protein n=1 Tax=Penicillium odoratum TaxID=1167516 RepID=UPI0025497760|nr:uncharacterized protein N7520_003857 [Penicillium odoratum]KAJ5769298.1 hypothetical protein N7520_003857 [Penicillium odoratum]